MSEFVAKVRAVQVGSVWFRPAGMNRDMMQPIDRRRIRAIIDNIIQAGLAHASRTLVFEGSLIVDVKPFRPVPEPYKLQAKILTLEGGHCKFAVAKAPGPKEEHPGVHVHMTDRSEEEREWVLPIDRDAIRTVFGTLMQAAVKGEQRKLKIWEGIITGAEEA